MPSFAHKFLAHKRIVAVGNDLLVWKIPLSMMWMCCNLDKESGILNVVVDITSCLLSCEEWNSRRGISPLVLLATVRVKATAASSTATAIVSTRFTRILGACRSIGWGCMVGVYRGLILLIGTAISLEATASAPLVIIRLGDVIIHALPRCRITAAAGHITIALVISTSAATSPYTAALIKPLLLIVVVVLLLITPLALGRP